MTTRLHSGLALLLLALLLLPQEEVRAESGDVTEIELDLGEIDVEGDRQIPLPATAPEPPSAQELAALSQPVAAARSGNQAQVITEAQIAASGAASVAELLQRSAGFNVSDSFTGSAVSYQGLPSKFTTVLLDGQRVPGSIMERSDFSQLRLDQVERIEIIRGPQASAFSGSSIGAVVNIITRQPEGGAMRGNLSVGTGSLGYGRARLGLEGGSEDGRERWLLALERSGRNRYDLDTRQPDTDGDGWQQSGILAKWSKELGANRLRLQLDWFDEQRRGNSYAPPNLLRNLDTATRRFQLDGSWRWGVRGSGHIELRHNYGSYSHSLDRYYLGYEDQTRTLTGFTDTLHDSALSYQQRADASGLSAGLQRSYNKLSSDRIDLNGQGTASSEAWAAYAAYEWELAKRWTASGALRLDSQQGFGSSLSPKTSLRYRLDQRSSLSASVGRGHRAPGLREQYYEFASPFGYGVIGNRDLRPESSWDYALDYDYAGPKGRFHTGLFHHRVRDLIDFSQIQTSPQVFQTVNIGNAVSYGAELSAERHWTIRYDSQREAAAGWGAGWDSTLIAHSEDSSSGNALPNAPRQNHTMRLFYREAANELSSQLALRYVGARWLDLANTERAPAYYTLDATLGRRLGGGRLELGGLNLLDEQDGRYGPEPGRELRASYTWEF